MLTPSRAICTVLLILGTAATGACASRREPTDVPPSATLGAVRQLLFSDLREQLLRSIEPRALDTTLVEVDSARSRAVPSITYFVAEYRDPNLTHSYASAVAGTNRAQAILLADVADWSALSDGWVPSDAATELEACAEVARFAGPNRSVRIPPRMFRDSLDLASGQIVGRDVPLANRLAAPVRSPEPTVSAWYFWMIETGSSTRYSCSIRRTARGSAELALRPIAVIPGLGFVNLRR